MTKKHFVALARILADTRASIETVERIADLCASLNPRFDCPKFMLAAMRGHDSYKEDRGRVFAPPADDSEYIGAHDWRRGHEPE